MKKVAIVTPEALAPRSFIWDDVPEVFKVRVSESPSNTLTKETDGLYVFGDGTVPVSPNVMSRHVFTDMVVNLPHFDLFLTNNSSGSAPLRLVTSTSIAELSIQGIVNNGTTGSRFYELSSGSMRLLDTENSIRIAYLSNDRIVVMDVFMFPNLDSESTPSEGFVDILINTKVSDFPQFMSGGIGTIIPSEPELA